jgi:hypothetical protein
LRRITCSFARGAVVELADFWDGEGVEHAHLDEARGALVEHRFKHGQRLGTVADLAERHLALGVELIALLAVVLAARFVALRLVGFIEALESRAIEDFGLQRLSHLGEQVDAIDDQLRRPSCRPRRRP